MPVSLSSAYSKVTGTRACVPSTTTYGMPYGGGPKSGCTWRVVPIHAMYAFDCGSSGAALTSRFHQFVVGNT